MNDQVRSQILGYGLAIVSTLLATWLRVLIDPYVGERVPFVTYFPAVFATAMYARLGPSLLAVLLSGIAAAHFFIPPENSLVPGGVADWTGVALFSFFGGAVGLLGQRIRRIASEQHASHVDRERLAALVDSSEDAILGQTFEGVVTTWNAGAERLFGYSADEVVGQSIFSTIVPPERKDELLQVLRRTQQGERIDQFETVRQCKDRRLLPIAVRISPICDAHGKPIGASAIDRDISQQRGAERRRSARLAVTQILAQERDIDKATTDTLVAVCDALEWTVGCFWQVEPPGQVLRCHKFWQKSPEGLDEFRAATKKLVFGLGESLPGRVWKTGQAVWVPDVVAEAEFVRAREAESCGLHGGFACPVAVDDEFLGVIEFFSDDIREPDDDLLEMMATIGGQVGQFIERRESERRLCRSEQELSDFFENAAVGLHWVGPDGTILRVNQAELDMLGYSRDEYIGHQITEFHVDQPVIEDILQCLTAGEELHDYEARLRCKDGTIKHVLIDSNVLWEDGEFVHTRCFTRDISERKQAESQLRQSEERLSLALEAGRMGTWEWHIPTGNVIWSPTLEEIHGLSPGSFSGTFEAYLQDIHPDDRRHVLETVHQTVEQGQEHHLEYRIIWPDDSVRWLEARGTLFYDDARQPVRMIGVCSDITLRKRLEQQLRGQLDELANAESRIRSVVDTVIDGIITIDERGIVDSFNPAAERIFGYSSAEVRGRNIRMLMPEPYHSEHDGYVANYLRTGDAKIIGIGREVTGQRKDGSTFPLDLAVSEFRLGQRRFFTGIVRDITSRKQTELSLRFLAEASRSLASLVDYKSTLQKVAHLAVPDFADWCTVDMVGADGLLERMTVTHKDPAKVQLAEELSRRYPPDPNASQGAMSVLRTGKSELAVGISDSMLEEAARDDDHLRILRELKLHSYISVPLKAKQATLGVITFVSGESGRVYGPDDLAMAEDLARRAAIAIENARLYQQVREADRRKDEFLAMLAHELRNPLAPIRSGLDILTMDTDRDPETVRLMQEQVEHMVRLVDDLLDVSRIMQGKVELRREPVELAVLVKRSVEVVRPRIEGHQQELVVSLPEHPIWLDADPVRLVQVIENLLNNASKYMDAGGQIDLTADLQDAGVVISVRDTGIGIERELLPSVFELFTQSSRSLDRAQGGLGIGLTLVKRLVQLHNGTVSASSDGPGCGSTFVVRLPATQVPVQTESAMVRPHAARSRRIAVVDDNVSAAWLLSKLLTKLGDHEVVTAHDGPSALAIIKENCPEIVLLDIGLPGMDGYEVGRNLREIPKFDDILLVALTGYGQEEDRQMSRAAGFDEHLVKPPSLDQLNAILAHPKLRQT